MSSTDCLAVLLLLVAAAASTAAESPQIIGVRSGLCIAVEGGSKKPGAGVVIFDCDQRPRSQWDFLEPEGNSEGGQIKGVGSGLCLAVSYAKTTPGSPIVAFNCDNKPRSQWVWLDKGGKGKMIQGVGSGLCLAVEGGHRGQGHKLVLANCDDTPGAQWNLLPPGGRQYIEYAPKLQGVGSKMCVGVLGESPAKGAQVHQWECNNHPFQQWEFLEPEGNSQGSEIRSVGSALCMAVQGASTKLGANIVIFDCDNQPRSQWIWVDSAAGGKMIQGIGSGHCLVIQGGSKVHGAHVVLGPCDGSPKSLWNSLSISGGSNSAGVSAGAIGGSSGSTDLDMYITRDYVSQQGADIPSGRELALISGVSDIVTCGKNCLMRDGCKGFVTNQARGTCSLKDNGDIFAVDDLNLWAGYFV